MKIRLLYFAAIRELVGMEAESVELPLGIANIAQLVAWIEAAHEPLRGRLASVRFARNESFVRGEDTISNEDVIALIPPVAGG